VRQKMVPAGVIESVVQRESNDGYAFQVCVRFELVNEFGDRDGGVM